jgi:ABC-type multidrug transport system fused ATPase/permease subunit
MSVDALPAAATAGATGSGMKLSEVLSLVGRAFSYIKPFWGRFLAKWFFTLGALLPIFYVPWPLKLITDYVVLGNPLDAAAIAKFPPYLQPFVRPLEGAEPAAIALAVVIVGAITVVTYGVFGQGASAQDATDGNLGEGQDIATRTENQANYAMSYGAGIFGFIDFNWQLRLSQSLNHYYRSKLFDRIKSLPMATLDDQRIGDSIFRVMYDTPMITTLCYSLFLTPTLATLTFLEVVYVMTVSFGQAPEVVIFAALVFPGYFLATAPFAGTMRRRSGDSRISGAQTTSTIEEGMSNVLAVQSLGGWRRERARFESDSRESFSRYRALMRGSIMYQTAGGLTSYLLYLGMVYVVAVNIIKGAFTVGDYAVLTYYFFIMAASATNFGRMWIDLQDNVVGLKRVFALMDLPAETDQGSAQLAPIKQGVSIEHATLVYPDGRRALDDVSIDARVGEVVAIVGPTGAGKTSLAYLIPRFHTPSSGRVMIDGVDIAGVTLDSLRGQIAYVFQETHLFSASIADNIRYAKPDATQAEIERVAKLAGAHDFIMALPEGYSSDLGARGGKLSVGQKQRIAIARGLLRDSRILILDEPTSALDPETEKALVESLHEAAKDRVVIIIAHRLSTISHADKIVFLEDGKVREQGTHEALLARLDGAYARFLKLQSAG